LDWRRASIANRKESTLPDDTDDNEIVTRGPV